LTRRGREQLSWYPKLAS